MIFFIFVAFFFVKISSISNLKKRHVVGLSILLVLGLQNDSDFKVNKK